MITTCPDCRSIIDGQHGARDVEQRVEVHVDHPRPLVARQLHERLERADAGVVDEHLRVDARERGRDSLRVGDVDDAWPAGSASRFDLLREGLELVVRSRDADDVEVVGQTKCDGAPNPSGRAGNDGDRFWHGVESIASQPMGVILTSVVILRSDVPPAVILRERSEPRVIHASQASEDRYRAKAVETASD